MNRVWLLLVACALAASTACSIPFGVVQTVGGSQPERTEGSAREAYPLAEQVARQWKSDAELRSVRAAWRNPTPALLRQGKTAWAFYFVSPSTKTVGKMIGYIVSVTQGKAAGIREAEFSSSGKSLIFVDWKVDSPQALKLFLENGGEDFLANNAQADAHATLLNAAGTQQPVWEVTVLNGQSKATFNLQLDASTGTVRRRSDVSWSR